MLRMLIFIHITYICVSICTCLGSFRDYLVKMLTLLILIYGRD
ncbi:hypothetical protein KSS87_023676 [Heliosperma pusillum]|nr:hypothetical protein KSS87_023676 [Heliosperma pusillum]